MALCSKFTAHRREGDRLIASAQVICLVREMKCVLLLYTMMEKTRDDLHSKPAEARPRRAREGWAAPGSEQAMDGSASLTIDPTNILGTGVGDLKDPGGSSNLPRDDTDGGWIRKKTMSHVRLSLRSARLPPAQNMSTSLKFQNRIHLTVTGSVLDQIPLEPVFIVPFHIEISVFKCSRCSTPRLAPTEF